MSRRGHKVAPFKKGPDYIDAAWLAQAAGRSCRNLDPWLMPEDTIQGLFSLHASKTRISIMEGNRGLFDGMDAQGSNSTAELCRILSMPVLLILPVVKQTRTAAAIVLGCEQFAQKHKIKLGGVVLNRVATARQKRVICQAIEDYTETPVLGAIPRLKDTSLIAGRHLGLIPVAEQAEPRTMLDFAAQVMEDHVDLDAVLAMADEAGTMPVMTPVDHDAPQAKVRIGVVRDGAFNFYYPENLQALEDAGARLVMVDALQDDRLPQLDALYVGGGFPETHLGRLERNKALRNDIRSAAAKGLPVYAECGGLMFLCDEVRTADGAASMCGVLPYTVTMHKKPAGHGYCELLVEKPNPFYAVGEVLRGHEFHYSRVEQDTSATAVCAMRRGTGLGNGRDGLCFQNVWASYTHIHAAGLPQWARGMIRAAQGFSSENTKETL